MVFESRHNIQNQPLSTAIPSPTSFRETSPRQEHISIWIRFLKTFFQDSMGLRHSTQANIILSLLSIGFHFYTQKLVYMLISNKFFLFSINLRILSFSQVGFSLHPMQVLKHLGLPHHLPTTSTNNTTILLPTLIGKESAFHRISY